MGSGSSKDSSSSGGARTLRSRVLGASCFSLPSTLDLDENENGNTKGSACNDEIGSKSKMLPLTLSEHRDEEISAASRIDLGASSSGASNRARLRFGFIPDRIGLRRLSRTISLGSSMAQSVIVDGVSFANSEGGDRAVQSTNDTVDNSNELTEENVNFESSSTQDDTRNNASTNADSIVNHSSENGETRRYNRRLGNQEPLEGSLRFSRTRSVGRLRDRVLRRTSSSAGIFGSALLEDRFTTTTTAGYNEQLSERRVMAGRRRLPLSSGNEIWPDFARSHPYHHVGRLTDSGYDHGGETLQLAEANNHDLVENRSAFLERRRRIRSQVRALQRLGSRFENLSGHERSCILSGQHRTGRCECRASNQTGNNPNDNTRTRASISRIVMLAEALFEVLDEIHQQSVALSSRPSFSSIGSVPAPKEVVECMPVKVYVKPQKQPNEEAAQCYICLVEYDDGDFMRILPCNHEFHQTCIDKWLKEIHRVCPLCRGDVCRSDAFDADNIS